MTTIDLLATKDPEDLTAVDDSNVHIYGDGIICATDKRGRALDPAEIVVDAQKGFVPLWTKDTTLNWRFQDRSFEPFRYPDDLKAAIRKLFSEGVKAWGDAAPVRFVEQSDIWDFEIVMQQFKNCNDRGCVLARAFFPDEGRHDIAIYPSLFEQNDQVQIGTLAHELGHVFGLRHFFAQISETRQASQIFGKHDPFTIMNYGSKSVLTDTDRADLARLYAGVWSGEIKDINGTPIRLMRAYHTKA